VYFRNIFVVSGFWFFGSQDPKTIAKPRLNMESDSKHCSSSVVLIAPTQFAYKSKDGELEKLVMAEFKSCVQALVANRIDVVDVYHESDIKMPAMIYPNWFATYESGEMVVMQMAYDYRQNETEMLQTVTELLKKKFEIKEIIDYRTTSDQLCEQALEGTSVMIHDRPNKVIYMNKSYASDVGLLDKHAERFGYQTISFDTKSEFISKPNAVYHTRASARNFASSARSASRLGRSKLSSSWRQTARRLLRSRSRRPRFRSAQTSCKCATETARGLSSCRSRRMTDSQRSSESG